MHPEKDNQEIEPILHKLGVEAEESPSLTPCDFRELTQSMVNDAIAVEIERNPEFAKKYDEMSEDEQITQPLTKEEKEEELKQLKVEAEIELIALSIGDNVVVKEEIYQFMMQLDTNSFTYAIAYIKRKISEFVERLKQEILHNSSSTGAEDYMKLLSNLNVFILLKYPINPDIYRHLVEELFRMYVELKSLSDLPIEALVSLHSQIEFFVSGSKLIIELPTELKESLQELTEHELISNTVAKPMSKQGENSLASFKIIPAPNDFPEVESFKKDALDILKDIESIVYGSMIRTSSFEQYFNITAEFECENLDEFSKEDIFKHICSSEKHKIDRALLKLRDLELKLDQILKELERKGEAYDTEMLPNYIKSVKTHIQQMWEKAIFPHLLFYGNLIFGKIPPGKPQWLYLKN